MSTTPPLQCGGTYHAYNRENIFIEGLNYRYFTTGLPGMQDQHVQHILWGG